MKKKFLFLVFATLALFTAMAFTACDDDENGLSASIKVDPETLPTFPASGDSKTITVTIDPATIQWTAEKSGEWISLDPIGDKLTVTAAKNEGAARAGSVTITADGAVPVTIPVNQIEAGEALFEVITTNLTFPASGGRQDVIVNADVEWLPTTEAGWLDITVHEGYFTVEAGVYDQTDKLREAEITVTAESINRSGTVKVTQNKASESATLEPDKLRLDFDDQGGEQTIGVTSNVEWWALNRDLHEWLDVKRQGDNIVVTVEENGDFDESRQAVITLEADEIDETIEILLVQDRRHPYMRVLNQNIEKGYNSTYVSIHVESNTTWKCTSYPGWFYSPATPEVTGDGYIRYRFYPPNLNGNNMGDTEPRSGEFILSVDHPEVDDVTVSITQLGYPPKQVQMTSREELYGEWDVTGQLFEWDGRYFPNDHVVTISEGDAAGRIFMDNITNVNAYDIGGSGTKGDGVIFTVRPEHNVLQLGSTVSNAVSARTDPNWYPNSGANVTWLCPNMYDGDVKFYFENSLHAPLMFVDMKEDGRHEIEFWSRDVSIVHEGVTYYGSMSAVGYLDPGYDLYIKTWGGKMVKRP